MRQSISVIGVFLVLAIMSGVMVGHFLIVSSVIKLIGLQIPLNSDQVVAVAGTWVVLVAVTMIGLEDWVKENIVKKDWPL